jgi:putative flavoprotein involved in K+ transport
MARGDRSAEKLITEQYDTVVIGGGQAGLAMGYYLAKQGRSFIILDAGDSVGGSWHKRWDSLQLFTPAGYSSLPGMAFQTAPDHFPDKDEMADYLAIYAYRFHLPVRLGTWVNSLTREGSSYIVMAGRRRFEADHVVVATGPFQKPKVPPFASQLDPEIKQIHSSGYRHPGQLQAGDTLVVGAGNSGAQIALELAKSHQTWLSGRDPGHLPQFRNHILQNLYWGFIHKYVTLDHSLGRRFKENTVKKGTPLIGISNKDFERAGIERVPRTKGVQDGHPVLEDGRVLNVTNVIWATGFTQNFSWIKLPVFDAEGYPLHFRGIVEGEPGLYFIGLPFQYSLTSALIGGVGRDAEYIASHIAAQPVPVHSLKRMQAEQPYSIVAG